MLGTPIFEYAGRKVWLLGSHNVSPTVISYLWERVKSQPIFDDSTRDRFDLWAASFSDSGRARLYVEEAGLLTLTNIHGGDADIHAVFWDTELGWRKKEIAIEALAWAFDKLSLHRLTAAVPDFNAPAKLLVATLGFTEEGRMREKVVVDGKRCDLVIYGLLAKEFANAGHGKNRVVSVRKPAGAA